METNYLESALQQFKYYKVLGDRTFAQLTEEQIFWQYNEESNSIAVMVKHLWGNMLSRWTDFLTSDGEKEWRNRDGEFEADVKSMDEMIAKWEAGWECLFQALDSVNEDNFHDLVYIRNQGHTIVEAVNRQLAHYAYHIGQIVYVARMMVGKDFTSLSIPKGGSKAFNEAKFAKAKRKEHFTTEFLEEDGDK